MGQAPLIHIPQTHTNTDHHASQGKANLSHSSKATFQEPATAQSSTTAKAEKKEVNKNYPIKTINRETGKYLFASPLSKETFLAS